MKLTPLSPYIFLFCLFLFLSGCSTYEINEVPGNMSPPDSTIEDLTYENYINTLYISLLGRKASENEFLTAFEQLKQNQGTRSTRETVVSEIMARPEYFYNLYAQCRRDLLQDLDTLTIREYLDAYIGYLEDEQYEADWEIYEEYANELQHLIRIPDDLLGAEIDIREVYKRCSDNVFYDEINMGTENFVVSMFQNFLFRYPSSNELVAASKMVDGEEAVLFLAAGENKQEFFSLFFGSNDFYEGAIQHLFLTHLYRAPTSNELFEFTTFYIQSGDWTEVQKKVLTLDEYFY